MHAALRRKHAKDHDATPRSAQARAIMRSKAKTPDEVDLAFCDHGQSFELWYPMMRAVHQSLRGFDPRSATM